MFEFFITLFDGATKRYNINWRKPNLNAQQNHFSGLFTIASGRPCYFVSLFAFLFFLFLAFFFHLLFSLSLTLIIGIFYCLNYILLLLDLIATHLESHLSLSSIVSIISTLIIGIFYPLNYTSLLPHLFIILLVIDFIISM